MGWMRRCRDEGEKEKPRVSNANVQGNLGDVASASGRRVSLLAVASLILGLAAFAFPLLPFVGVPPIVCGVLAFRRIRASHGSLTGGLYAGIGIGLGISALFVMALFFLRTPN